MPVNDGRNEAAPYGAGLGRGLRLGDECVDRELGPNVRLCD